MKTRFNITIIHLLTCTLVLYFSTIQQGLAQQTVLFNGTTYTQDFQTGTAASIAPSATSNTKMFADSAQINGATGAHGWYFYGTTGPRYGVMNGSNATGSFGTFFDKS